MYYLWVLHCYFYRDEVMGEKMAVIFGAFWVVAAMTGVVLFVWNDIDSDWPSRECVNGKLYRHYTDGIYIDDNTTCFIKEKP